MVQVQACSLSVASPGAATDQAEAADRPTADAWLTGHHAPATFTATVNGMAVPGLSLD